jgi:hypothetical protein
MRNELRRGDPKRNALKINQRRDPTLVEASCNELIRADTSRNKTKRFYEDHMADNRFSRSYDVQQIVDALATAKVGDTITYEQLAKLGADHRTPKGQGKLQSARRILQRDKQMVFATIATVGYQRLNDSEIIKTGQSSIEKIRRESMRGLKRLACVNPEPMPDSDKRKHYAAASHLGILAECSRPAVVKKIAVKVDETKAKLTFDATLEAFRQ